MNILIIKIPTFLDIFNVTWKLFLFIGFIYFIYLFIRIHKNESKLLSLYEKRDEKINKIKKQEQKATSLMNGDIRNIEFEFQKEISKIKLQRTWDLEKIPFLKK